MGIFPHHRNIDSLLTQNRALDDTLSSFEAICQQMRLRTEVGQSSF